MPANSSFNYLLSWLELADTKVPGERRLLGAERTTARRPDKLLPAPAVLDPLDKRVGGGVWHTRELPLEEVLAESFTSLALELSERCIFCTLVAMF